MFRPIILSLALAVGAFPGAAGQEPKFDEALILARTGSTADALSMFSRLAERGHAPAQINLAVLLARGQGIPQDDQRAAYWAWRAWLSGEPRAAKLSSYLLTRLPEKAQKTLADTLDKDLQARAAKGDTEAFLALGRLEQELREPARPAEAMVWLSLAAALDVRHAVSLRELAARGLQPEERIKAQEKARAAFEAWCASRPEDSIPAPCLTLLALA